MTDPWQAQPISALCRWITSGGTPSRQRQDYFGGDIPWVKTQELRDGWIEDTEEKITPTGLENSAAKIVPANTILVAMYGATVGKLGLLRREATCNQACCVLVVDEAKADFRYVYYQLLLNRPSLARLANGAAQQNLNVGLVSSFQISVAPLPVQQRIVELLGGIDDKIDCNRRINDLLLKMARALFQHWFVDFGPFQKRGLQDSDIGPIPKGWSVITLDVVCEVNARTLTPKSTPTQIRYIDISSVSNGVVSHVAIMPFAGAPSRARRIVADGDTVWSMVRPDRRSHFLCLSPEADTVVSTGFAVLTPRGVPFSWLYLLTIHDSFIAYLASRATGAAYPAVTAETFEKAMVVLPPAPELTRFHEQVEPWFRQRRANERENLILAQTRDYLLPKLLSGEVEVKAAEREVEAGA